MRVFSDLWVELGSIREKQNYVVTVREIPRPWLKKKRYFVLLTFQTTLSLGTRLSKKAVISQTKRDITLKDTHEARVDSDDSWGVRAMRNFPPPPTPAEIWLSAACHQLSCRLTHTCTLKNKPTYKHTHQTDIVWMLHRSEPGQSLFWCKAFWEFCLPPSSFYFFSFSSI